MPSPPRSIVVVTFPMDQAPADGALTLRLARYKTPVRTVLRLHRLDLVIEVAAWRKGPAAFRERLLNPLPELSRRPMVQICATDNGTIRIRPTPARKPEAGAVSRQTARTSPDIPSSASSRAVSPAPVAYFPPVAAASASVSRLRRKDSRSRTERGNSGASDRVSASGTIASANSPAPSVKGV